MEGSEPPELPSEIAYIWNDYCQIIKGCERLTWSELRSYGKLTGINLTPWESSIMIELDMVRRTSG